MIGATPPRSAHWDDDRLAAAFAARAASVPRTPPDLVPAIVARLAREPQARTRSRPLGFLAAAAALILVLGAGGLAVLTLSHQPHVASSASPSAGPSDPVAAAADRYGLVEMSVPEALAVRDQGFDGRELLVSGYLSNDPSTASSADTGLSGCVTPDGPSAFLTPRCVPRLMADPESIISRTLSSVSVREPTGPAFFPLFALTGLPPTRAVPLVGDAVPSPITVIGHFYDRRQSDCDLKTPVNCSRTFVVDRIVRVDGRAWLTEDASPETAELLDQIVPGIQPLSVSTVAFIDLREIEPVFASSDRPPADLGDVVRIVTALDPVAVAGPNRRARTFLVGASRSVIIEMTRDGPVLRVPAGQAESSAPSPAADMPGQIHGIDVISVSGAIAIGASPTELTDRELAVHGWYVSPPRLLSCPMIPADLGPIEQRCPDGFRWLMQEPERLTLTTDPTSERHPPSGPALNPLVRPVVPVAIPDAWLDDPTPREVVVLGHFFDPRARSAVSARSFVVDALVWTAAGLPALDTTVLRGVVPTETPDAVGARVDALLTPAEATWIAAIPGSDLPSIDPDVATVVPELRSAPVVWIAQRLVVDRRSGIPEAVVQWAYTADEGTRVWQRDTGCCRLAPERTVELAEAYRVSVSIVDDADQVERARADDSGIRRDWSTPTVGWETQVARGDTDRELAVRWISGSCDQGWTMEISKGPQIDLRVPSVGNCSGTRIQHGIVLTFDHPIDPATVKLPENLSGG